MKFGDIVCERDHMTIAVVSALLLLSLQSVLRFLPLCDPRSHKFTFDDLYLYIHILATPKKLPLSTHIGNFGKYCNAHHTIICMISDFRPSRCEVCIAT